MAGLAGPGLRPAAAAELLVPVPAQQPAGVGQGGGLVRVQDREQAAGVRWQRPGQRRDGLVQRGQVGRDTSAPNRPGEHRRPTAASRSAASASGSVTAAPTAVTKQRSRHSGISGFLRAADGVQPAASPLPGSAVQGQPGRAARERGRGLGHRLRSGRRPCWPPCRAGCRSRSYTSGGSQSAERCARTTTTGRPVCRPAGSADAGQALADGEPGQRGQQPDFTPNTAIVQYRWCSSVIAMARTAASR